MTSLFSWLKGRDNTEDYESILSQLDTSISQTEHKLILLTASQTTVLRNTLLYTSISLCISLSVLYTVYELSVLNLCLICALACGTIYFVYWGIQIVYKSKYQSVVNKLESLKATQKLKIEELKKKTAYYVTKGLIERYETPQLDQRFKTPQQIRHRQPQSGAQPQNQRPLEPKTKPTQPKLVVPTQIEDPVNPFTPSTTPLPDPPSLSNPQQAVFLSHPIQHLESQSSLQPSSRSSPFRTPPQQQYPYQPLPLQPQQQQEKTWVDSLLQAIIGDISTSQEYALICEYCFTHNGLSAPDEYYKKMYKCKACGRLNGRGLVNNEILVSEPPTDESDIKGALGDEMVRMSLSMDSLEMERNRVEEMLSVPTKVRARSVDGIKERKKIVVESVTVEEYEEFEEEDGVVVEKVSGIGQTGNCEGKEYSEPYHEQLSEN